MSAVLQYCEGGQKEVPENGIITIVDIPASTASVTIVRIQVFC